MATHFIESVPDDAAFDALCPTLPGKTGLAYQIDIAALSIKPGTGVKVEIPVAPLAALPSTIAAAAVGVAAGYKIARGVHTQVAASDTVVTGLATVVAVVVSFQSSPTVKQLYCAASIGDQAGTPAAGSILIATFKPTAVNDCTPTAATDFTENLKLGWVAIGT